MFTSITNLLTRLATELKGIANPLGIVAMICCGLLWLVSSDPQTVMKAKQWLFRIFIGIVVVNLASTVIEAISSSVAG